MVGERGADSAILSFQYQFFNFSHDPLALSWAVATYVPIPG